MSDEFIQLRRPSDPERYLIAALIAKADLTLPVGWLETFQVEPLTDGGMGSLRFHFPQLTAGKDVFAKQASELIFNDVDGVQVLAALNLGSSGLPIELDLWKSDFSRVIKIPDDV